MSIRLVSSAKNLREQFKSPSSNGSTQSNIMSSSTASTYTSSSGVSRSNTLEPPTGSSLSRRNSLMRTSSGGNLRRAKSIQKKGLMSKVFADEGADPHEALPDLSMEMTLLIVKRCIKEIRERGLATKGILRQVQMAQSQKVIIETIRMILDDDASTELSPLHQLDIHLVAHAMKWAIRYSEEILVTYEDYQALYVNQDRNFPRFARDLPPTNRAILLDLFSLCADVTLLAHLNNMTLVAVAKAISLSIMAGPEREFTTFDASLQQRNLWGAACEDLLRAFLRIKTTYDLAKIDQEDDVDENRYICNETRVLKSARQCRNEVGRVPTSINLPARIDISMPSSAASSVPGSEGGHTPAGPMSAGTPHSYTNSNGYFDIAVPRSASPLSQSNTAPQGGESFTRNQPLARSATPVSAPIVLTPYQGENITEYEELMQDQSHLQRLRSDRNNFLRPAAADPMRRRSSVADMESLYMLPIEAAASVDGYESDPEVSHAHEDEDDVEEDEARDSLIPDFADGLGWDFSKPIDTHSSAMPSLHSFQSRPSDSDKHSINRSNSAGSNASGLGANGPSHPASPRSIQELSKQHLTSMRLRHLQEQHQHGYTSHQRDLSQHDQSTRESLLVTPSIGSPNHTRVGQHYPARTSPSIRPHRSKRNSGVRRSISVKPASIIHKRPQDLQADLLAHEMALQAERDYLVDDIRFQLLQVKNGDHQEPSRASSAFSLQLSPLDLERPAAIPPSRILRLSAADRPKSMLELNMISLPSVHQLQRTILSATEEPVSETKSSEVVSHPSKDQEVNVVFNPIPLASPVSPHTELRSKFLESFPERPISPPPGYGGHPTSGGSPKRSMTNASGKSDHSIKMSPSASTGALRQQQHQGSLSSSNSLNKRRPSIQQSVSFSGVSTLSSQPSNGDGRSKTSGFMRALSSKLRSKQSDGQLKTLRIDSSQVSSACTTGPPTASLSSAVSFEPPRLELSFMDDGLGPSELGLSKDSKDRLPPTSAPVLQRADSATRTLENWRREAQNSLPIPPESTDGNITGSQKHQQQRDLRPAGFSGMRRASASVLGSGPYSHRDQHSGIFKTGAVSFMNPLLSRTSARGDDMGDGAEKTLQVADHEIEDLQVSSAFIAESNYIKSNIIPKTAAVEKELRFSTVTLLKDGKLYYQLQWDQFSELGFKSDTFASTADSDPPKSPAAAHPSQLRLSQEDPQKAGEAAMSMTGVGMKVAGAAANVHQQQQSQRPHPLRPTKTANSCNPSLDLPGQLGHIHRQASGKVISTEAAMVTTHQQDRGPSPAQKAAAMKVARESFMALANDPQALSALMADPAMKNGLSTMIINSGTFAKGSTLPQVVHHLPLLRPPVITSKAIRKQELYPDPSPKISLKSARSLETAIVTTTAMPGEGRDSVQRSMSASSKFPSPTSSVTEEAPFSAYRITQPHGSVAVGGGGPGSSVSSLSVSPHLYGSCSNVAAVLPSVSDSLTAVVSTASTPPATKAKSSSSRFFGKRSSLPKKSLSSVRLLGSTTSLASALPSSTNGKRKRRLFPVGVKRHDVMTRTVESMDEVFPWMCIEHMAGQESGWVMLEPVQDGAVGWVMIDKLEDGAMAEARAQVQAEVEGLPQYYQHEQQHQQQYEQQECQQQGPPLQSRTATQAQIA